MVCNPCCCNLQTGVKVLAILELISSLLVAFAGFLSFGTGISTTSTDARADLFLGLGVVLLILGCGGMILSIILLRGAIERSATKCLIWLVVAIAFLFLHIAELVLYRTLAKIYGSYLNEDMFNSKCFGLVVQMYYIWVVWAFICQIKEVRDRDRDLENSSPSVQYSNNKNFPSTSVA